MATHTTNDQLAVMNFGYLTGRDLMRWISAQILISRETVLPGSLADGCNTAYDEVTAMFYTKYNVQSELTMISGKRDESFAKFVGIIAVRNIAGNLAGLGPVTEGNFKWAEDMLTDVRAGISNFALHSAPISVESGSFLVRQNFGTIG